MAGQPLNGPVSGMASAPDGLGYWLVAADGGVFSFGDAVFAGTTSDFGPGPGFSASAPVRGMAADPVGGGYWLVASDGRVFACGAPSFGSA